MPSFSPGTAFALTQILRGFSQGSFSDVVSSYEKYTNHYFFHPALENEIPVPQSDIINALDYLDNQGVLLSEETITRYCIDCFSLDVELSQKCPSCGSLDVIFGKTLTHKCGYRDVEGNFGNPENMICPGCKEGIYSIFSECEVGEPTFMCRACKSYFGVATPAYVCNDCSRIYKVGEEPYVRIKKYEPAPLLIAIKPDIISTFKLYEALCGYLEKKDLQLRKNAILDEGEIITYWNALLYAQNSKERFGILVLSPIEKLDFETVESLIRIKKAAKLDAVFAILASNVPQDQSKRLSDERILIVNPRLTRFDIESELGKTVSPLIK